LLHPINFAASFNAGEKLTYILLNFAAAMGYWIEELLEERR
jgi:hypothetical protein